MSARLREASKRWLARRRECADNYERNAQERWELEDRQMRREMDMARRWRAERRAR